MIDYGLEPFESLKNDEDLKKIEEKVLIGLKIAANAMELMDKALEKREEILCSDEMSEAVEAVIPGGTLTEKDEAIVEAELKQLKQPIR